MTKLGQLTAELPNPTLASGRGRGLQGFGIPTFRRRPDEDHDLEAHRAGLAQRPFEQRGRDRADHAS